MTVSVLRIAAITALAGFALAAPLAAQMAMQPPGARDAARVTAGTYTADIHHTMVGWRVDHMGITPYFGTFGDVTGTLQIDPKNLSAAKVDMTIPVSKVTTASPGLTAHMLRPARTAGGTPDLFGAAPADARFVSTSVVPGEDGKAKLTGNLTLLGRTHPVTLDVSFYGAGKMPAMMGGGEQIGFTATGTIKRSDFGITMAIPMVSDAVQLDIVAAFAKS
jgi:polyisoprenoid-binding protein YceI